MFGGDIKIATRPAAGLGVAAVAIILSLAALALVGSTAASAEPADKGPTGQAGATKKAFRVVARPSRRATKPRGVIRVRGNVRPRAPRQRVLLQARLGGSWRAVGRTRLSRRSTFRIPFRARRPGGQLLRVLKLPSHGRRASASRVIRIVAMARRTTRSDGGRMSLGLGPVRIVAPKGAIRKGKTLTIRTAPPRGPRGFSQTQAVSLVGGPYIVSTSQGKPSRPVIVRLRYDRSSISESGAPLVLHGLGKLGWLPERTLSNDRVVIARLGSFSPLDVVDDITWWAGRVTGNRTELPGNCGEVPDWITGADFPHNRNEALPSCISNRTDAGALRVNIVNNRGYAQLVTVDGARVAAERSGSWTTSVDRIITNELARRNSGNGPSSFVLGPGASATIALDRPLDLVGQRKVAIRGAPRGGSAVAQLAWALVSAIEKVKKKVAIPRSVTNCVTGVLHNSTSRAANAASSISGLRSCLEAGAGLSGIAKAALRKIGSAVLVTDVFHKVVDLAGDEAFPPRMEFVFQGASKTNPDIELSNLDIGTVPAGTTTTRQLAANGGSPPYVFAISTIPKNIGRVPDWASLSADGMLSLSPPPGTDGVFAFSVFVTDSTGRKSATGIYEIKFRVDSDAPDPFHWTIDGPFTQIASGKRRVCGLRYDGSVECFGESHLGQSSPPPVADRFSQVSAGYGYHTCGLQEDGAATCWGHDSHGQASPPTGSFSSISVARSHTCGLRENRTAECWGHEYYGQSSPPDGIFKQVVAEGDFSCGLREDYTAECWGRNSYGQASPPGGTFTQISVGPWVACGLRESGIPLCWGRDCIEETCYGLTTPPSGEFVELSPGAFHSCGLRTNGTAVCWGFDAQDQASPPGGTFTQITTGEFHACGLRENGRAVCWGSPVVE